MSAQNDHMISTTTEQAVKAALARLYTPLLLADDTRTMIEGYLHAGKDAEYAIEAYAQEIEWQLRQPLVEVRRMTE